MIQRLLLSYQLGLDGLLGRQRCGQRRWGVLIAACKQSSMRRGVSIEQDQISVFVGKFGRNTAFQLFRLVGYDAV